MAGLAILTVSVLAPIAANAESLFDLFSPSVSPGAVQYNLARAGFVARSAMVRRGDVYMYDVSDRYGVPQRLIIDTHTGRIVERYALRPAVVAEARRRDVRPLDDDDSDFDWTGAPRPGVDLPMARARVDAALVPPRVIEAPRQAPQVESAPLPPKITRPRDFAYGGGHTQLQSPPALEPSPDPKPVEKPKPRFARPKPAVLPSPAVDASKTATVSPTAVDPSASQTSATVAPATPQPAAAEPATPPTTGMVASSGASDTAPAAKPAAPQPAAAPAPKAKAINDIPVAPLD